MRDEQSLSKFTTCGICNRIYRHLSTYLPTTTVFLNLDIPQSDHDGYVL